MNVTAKDLYHGESLIKAPKKVWDPRFNGVWAMVTLDLFFYFVSIALAYKVRLPDSSTTQSIFHISQLPYFLILLSVFQVFDAYNTRDTLGSFSLASKSLIAGIFIVPGIMLFDYLFGVYEFNIISGRGISLIFGSTFIFLSALHRYIFSNYLILNKPRQKWAFLETKMIIRFLLIMQRKISNINFFI